MTGEDARKTSPSPEIFQGLDIISGPIVEAFLFQNNTKTVLLLDEFMQVSLTVRLVKHSANAKGNYRFIYTRIPPNTQPNSMQQHHHFISQYALVAKGNDSSWAISSFSILSYRIVLSATPLGRSHSHQTRRSSPSYHPRVDQWRLLARFSETVRRYISTSILT